ncbi:hypothetical protein [Sodalis sp.]
MANQLANVEPVLAGVARISSPMIYACRAMKPASANDLLYTLPP